MITPKKATKKAKKKIFIIAATLLVVILVTLLAIFCLTAKDSSSNEVDFNQKVTDEKGADFNPQYNTKQDANLSIRFADLECNEDCSNISTVKIDDKVLKRGEDYEVKHGSVIIVIFKKAMQVLPAGKVDIIVDVTKDGKTIAVGVQITVTSDKTQETETVQEPQQEDNNPNGDSAADNTTPTSQGNDPAPQSSTPTQPERPKTCSELQNCDFNLNDRYIIETDTYNFYKLPEGIADLCDQNEAGVYYVNILPAAETRTFYQIGNFTGKGGGNVPHATPTRTDYTHNQAQKYATSRGLALHHDGWGCGGMGDIIRDWTWQETIDRGFALDEAKCATWGLSCGRW